MKQMTGDIIQLALGGHFNVIIHGCNCFNTMGAGIAKAIKQTFPEAYTVDCGTVKGSKVKLGNYTYAVIDRDNRRFVIVNAYTQFGFGHGAINYTALDLAFQRIARDFANQSIAYPLIGAGLAGGDWNMISKIIDRRLAGMDHTLVTLPTAQSQIRR